MRTLPFCVLMLAVIPAATAQPPLPLAPYQPAKPSKLSAQVADSSQTQLASPIGSPQQNQFVQPSSYTSVIAARREAARSKQIRVEVQYLLVDDQLRQQIYQQAPEGALKTDQAAIAPTSRPDLPLSPGTTITQRNIQAISRLTHGVLPPEVARRILVMVEQSGSADASRAPIMMLLENKQAEMNEVVERPFVIAVESDSSPEIHVAEEGNRFRLHATVPAPATDGTSTEHNSDSATNAIQLSAELTCSKILSLDSDQVYVSDSTNSPAVATATTDRPSGQWVTLPTPKQETVSVATSVTIPSGHTLLMDPSFQRVATVKNATAVPVLGRLPYVGKNFSDITEVQVQQNFLVLLTPTIVAR